MSFRQIDLIFGRLRMSTCGLKKSLRKILSGSNFRVKLADLKIFHFGALGMLSKLGGGPPKTILLDFPFKRIPLEFQREKR